MLPGRVVADQKTQTRPGSDTIGGCRRLSSGVINVSSSHTYRKVLVTGGAGFIGSNFVRLVHAEHPDWTVVVLDALTYAGNRANLEGLDDRIEFIRGDLRDYSVANDTVAGQDIVFHLANIHGGRGFIDTHPGEIVQNFAIDGNVFRAAEENGKGC